MNDVEERTAKDAIKTFIEREQSHINTFSRIIANQIRIIKEENIKDIQNSKQIEYIIESNYIKELEEQIITYRYVRFCAYKIKKEELEKNLPTQKISFFFFGRRPKFVKMMDELIIYANEMIELIEEEKSLVKSGNFDEKQIQQIKKQEKYDFGYQIVEIKKTYDKGFDSIINMWASDKNNYSAIEKVKTTRFLVSKKTIDFIMDMDRIRLFRKTVPTLIVLEMSSEIISAIRAASMGNPSMYAILCGVKVAIDMPKEVLRQKAREAV